MCVWVGQGGKEVVTSTGGTMATPAMSVIYYKCVLTDSVCMCDCVCYGQRLEEKRKKHKMK